MPDLCSVLLQEASKKKDAAAEEKPLAKNAEKGKAKMALAKKKVCRRDMQMLSPNPELDSYSTAV